jgi:phosphatidylinositol alpha-1,6-mannosyltransferase
MEILFVSHKYPPAVGGMEKQSFELIRGMEPSARVHKIVYDGRESRLRFFRMLRRRILQTCREYPGISVIHFNDGLLAAVCLRHKGYEHLKRTATLHGLDVVFPNAWFQRFVLPQFDRLDLIIAVSHATANACIERGLSPQKVVVVPNGVDTGIADTPRRPDFYPYFEKKYHLDISEKKVIVAMGRSVRRKGFSWFIREVLPQLSGDFIFLIIGPFHEKPTTTETALRFLPAFLRRQIELFLGFPTDEPELRRLLAEPGTRSKARHLGKLPFEDIVQILSAANAFLMPNIRIEGDMEGFGLVCLEACLCGASVFAADTDGIPDAIHDKKNGILLPSGDAMAWAAALNGLFNNPAAAALPPGSARAYTLEHFSWGKMAEGYYEYFQRLEAI